MPLLFAVGVSLGMASKTDGTSALAGLVSWLTITTLLSPATIQNLTGAADIADVDPAFGKVQNVFVGIIAGLIGAWCYNKFKTPNSPTRCRSSRASGLSRSSPRDFRSWSHLS